MAVQSNTPMSAYPAILAAAVTLSDSADLSVAPCRALYVGVGGDVNLDMTNGDTILFKNVPSGSVLPLSVKRVRNTSTTASSIVALY